MATVTVLSHRGVATALAAILMLVACVDGARLPFSAGVGPEPALPPPQRELIPTLHIAPAVGWPAGRTPTPAAGLMVNAFASGLRHPRWLYELPDGGILVAETNAPPKPAPSDLRGWFMQLFMKRAGAGEPSANRITLLRDTDGDGIAETRTVYLDNLNSPFGIALVGDTLYVANTDAVIGFPYVAGQTGIAARGRRIVELPSGTPNRHWTRNLVADSGGKHLYVTVGSNSNVGENGLDSEAGRAAIWEIDLATGTHRIVATGLRNPNGMAWEPRTGRLWTVVNERDELGSDLVPDYLTAVRDGAHYGWPYSYYGAHVDARVKPQRPDIVASAVVPDYALGTHVAPLGLIAARGNALGPQYADGFFIGQHGSWNRKPRSGYNVVFVATTQDGRPTGAPFDVLSGFVSPEGDAWGRPVGVAIDQRGALLVADDVGNSVWRVTRDRGAGGTRASAAADRIQ